MQLKLKQYGETGILAYDLSDLQRSRLFQALGGEQPESLVEYIEGYNTVLFIFKQPNARSGLVSWLKNIKADQDRKPPASRIHKIPVVYDGPDLNEVAKQTSLSAEEVVRIHSSVIYTVRMMGFSPGFPYLDGLNERLHLPRKATPRNRIEPGAVAIGGSHAGIYSVASPGGWHLLGRTTVQLFHAKAAQNRVPDPDEIFLLAPGDRVNFQPINGE